MKPVITLCPKCGRPQLNGEIICKNCLSLKQKKTPRLKRGKILTKTKFINNIRK